MASSVAVAYLPREKVLLAGDVVIYPLPCTLSRPLLPTSVASAKVSES